MDSAEACFITVHHEMPIWRPVVTTDTTRTMSIYLMNSARATATQLTRLFLSNATKLINCYGIREVHGPRFMASETFGLAFESFCPKVESRVETVIPNSSNSSLANPGLYLQLSNV